ncbi:vinorine synthase-like protein [Tanacetum coccineum]
MKSVIVLWASSHIDIGLSKLATISGIVGLSRPSEFTQLVQQEIAEVDDHPLTMKWLFSAKNAARRILSSQQYHLLGGSRSRFTHAKNNIGWSNLYHIRSSSLFSCNYHYSTSTLLNTKESSHRLMNENTQENNIQKVDLEVISRETIKPTSPTPHHLRTFNLSIIDNIVFDVYTPLILFLPNTNKASVTDVVTKRSKHLKEALSQTLTQFYPVAGKIMDNLHIKCNDEGVYYKETRVNQALNDFLSDPDDPKVRELIPEHPRTSESSIGNFLLGVQKLLEVTLAKTISPSFGASKDLPANPAKITQFLHKVAAKAASTVRSFSPQLPYALLPVVNLRERVHHLYPLRALETLSLFLHLNDMLKGGGVEAIVTLSPEEMEIFERDPKLLSFATANPCPLQFLNN